MDKIGFLVYSMGGGGAERMVSRLCAQFVERGYSVTIIAFDTQPGYDLPPEVNIINCSNAGRRRFQRFCKTVKAIRCAVKREELDVLIAFSVSMVTYALLGTMAFRTKVIGSERWNPKKWERTKQYIIKYLTPLCDGFIFQTSGARDYYPKRVRKKAVVIGNIAPDSIVRQEPKKENSICAVGRLAAEKDYITALRAISIVKEKKFDVEFHIYGQGDMKEQLVQMRKELYLENNVVFEGFVTNITDEIQKYSVFLLSSWAEGMPNVLLEAMSVGMACVATDCDFGPGDLIRDGENGYLVPVGDAETMAERLLFLLDNPNERKRVEEHAVEVKDKYSGEKITSLYIDYLERVFEGKY